MKKILLLILLISFSGYGQRYYMDYGSMAGTSITFPKGSYVNIEDSVVEYHIVTHNEPRFDSFRVTDDKMYTSNGRTIREMRLLSDLNPNLRIHLFVIASSESKTVISVNLYDVETQKTTPYVIYTIP